jgi:hypothetical protein
MVLHGEASQKLIDTFAPQDEGVDPLSASIAVEEEEPCDPADIGFLRPLGDVHHSHGVPYLFHEFRVLERTQRIRIRHCPAPHILENQNST